MRHHTRTKSTMNRLYPVFVLPSFAIGAASAFDMFGTLNTFKYSPSDIDADFMAIRSDVNMVGHDFADSLVNYSNAQKK